MEKLHEATRAESRLVTSNDAGIASVRGMRAFRVNRDQSFLWLGEAHRGVLDALYLAVLSGSPLVILTGDVGAGKTMLAEALAARLAETGVVVGRVLYPSQDPDDFWNAIFGAFGLPADSAGRDAALTHFTDVVQRVGCTSGRVLLVIDEAQVLTSEVLMEVGRACDAAREAAGPNVLTVLLVGEEALDVTLARPELADVTGRIGMRRRLGVLGERDVALYIRHRLACAGVPPDVFTSDALRAIAAFSRGIPRLINTLCARTLVNGGVVDATIVERAAAELANAADGGRGRARLPSKLHGHVVSAARARPLGIGINAVLASAGIFALAVSWGGESRPPSRRAQSASPATAMAWEVESTRPAVVSAAATPGPDVLIARHILISSTRSADTAARPPDDAPRDPDPGAIIDWLLKDRSQAATINR
jgi:general secretion pathway protein A